MRSTRPAAKGGQYTGVEAYGCFRFCSGCCFFWFFAVACFRYVCLVWWGGVSVLFLEDFLVKFLYCFSKFLLLFLEVFRARARLTRFLAC